MKQFDFTEDEIRGVPPGRLLTMEIEFTLACNYRCPYCYATENDPPKDELSEEENRSALKQAQELGARKIIILGGEPLIYPKLTEMIDYINELDMAVEIFTNGELLTEELASFFKSRNCRMVVKFNSFKEEIHDKMTGRKGSLAIAMRTLERLQNAGYRDMPDMLCASTVLSTENLEEAPELWRFLRSKGISPYFECITPQGRMRENPGLLPDSDDVKRIFDELARIDSEYGYEWTPQPPLAGDCCFRHTYSCVVHSNGDVTPCVGLDLVIGSIRTSPIEEIIRNSRTIQRLKNYRQYIKSPCKECEKIDHCYGCRGTAWQLTGDYLAADPTCWRNKGKKITALPADVSPYLPHRPPIVMVSKILSLSDTGGRILAEMSENTPFMRADKILDPASIPEIAAQSVAAVNGFLTPDNIPPGILAEASHLKLFAPIRSGEQIITEFHADSDFPPWHIVSFRIISSSGERKAEGVLKLCVPGE